MMGSAFVLMFVALLLWLTLGLRLCVALASRYLRSGRRAACRRVMAVFRAFPRDLGGADVTSYFRIRLASDEAHTSSAIAELERAIDAMPNQLTQALRSASLADIWVNAGCYHSAILAPRLFGWRALRRRYPDVFGIAHINRAEALHNVGRNDLALKLLARAPRVSAIAKNGGLALEAWILADIGRASAAKELFNRIDPRPLSPYYASEMCFTRALIALTSGDYESALIAASDGLARVVRASSERNGLFLLGRIEALRGNLEQAIAHYERGRWHRYRGQSARGLFELGQLYEQQNLPQVAHAAYAQAIEEDAESAAAARCRARLDRLAPLRVAEPVAEVPTASTV